YLAPTTFVPWYLLVNRTVISTNIMMFFWEVAGFIWNAYFYSMLIVFWRQSVTNATYINNIYFVGSTIWMLMLGVACRYYGHIKYYSLTLGIPVVMLGTGLMIKYRTKETDIRLVIMCQIIVLIGSGTMYPFEQMTLMAVSPPQHVAALLAVESLLASAGKAVGSAIASAIWTGVFSDRLARYLPKSALPDLSTIYGDIDTQSSFVDGSPERLGVTHSYADTQRIMLIASTCLYVVTFVAVLCWEDIDVKKMKKLTRVA
ncbi:uncharacterized protein ASPGLDRAFT_125730, partial [Aspergillus glaucus CBS 516.65]